MISTERVKFICKRIESEVYCWKLTIERNGVSVDLYERATPITDKAFLRKNGLKILEGRREIPNQENVAPEDREQGPLFVRDKNKGPEGRSYLWSSEDLLRAGLESSD